MVVSMSPSTPDQSSQHQYEKPVVANEVPSIASEELEEERANTMHQLLARQLEYYFSTANSDKDTYLSTLRSLNDGYVPLSIIANFGKVQALAPFDGALPAVQTAVTAYSNLLDVVHVDSETGRRLSEEEMDQNPSKKTLLAVGPLSGEPIPMELISTALGGTSPATSPAAAMETPVTTRNIATSLLITPGSNSSGGGVQNTVILREAPEGTTEESVRNLFSFDGCPAIESVHLDLQNYW